MASIRRSLTPYAGVPAPDGAAAMRRSDPRMEASQRLVLMVDAERDGQAESRCVDGWTLNVSRGGLRIIAEAQLELGDEIMIRAGDDAPLRPGRVVWVQDEPDGCIAGIAYLDVDHDEKPPPAPEGAKQ